MPSKGKARHGKGTAVSGRAWPGTAKAELSQASIRTAQQRRGSAPPGGAMQRRGEAKLRFAAIGKCKAKALQRKARQSDD